MSNIDLAALYPVDDGDLTRLHARLAAAAERDDALDVAYRTIDSPRRPLADRRDTGRVGARCLRQ